MVTLVGALRGVSTNNARGAFQDRTSDEWMTNDDVVESRRSRFQQQHRTNKNNDSNSRSKRSTVALPQSPLVGRGDSADLSGMIGGLHLPSIAGGFHDRQSNSSSFLLKESSVKKMFSLVPLGDFEKYESNMNMTQ